MGRLEADFRLWTIRCRMGKERRSGHPWTTVNGNSGCLSGVRRPAVRSTLEPVYQKGNTTSTEESTPSEQNLSQRTDLGSK
jgi:hypothetical protein